MVGYANINDMKIWCDLAEFVERNYVSFIVNVNGRIKCFKKYVRFRNESKSLYVSILGTRIFYEDFE